MLIKKDTLCLDHIITKDRKGRLDVRPISEGLAIKVKENDNYVEIAHIYWNELSSNCFIQTIDDRLQTYIVLPETYANFIYLVDEAYYMICLANTSTF